MSAILLRPFVRSRLKALPPPRSFRRLERPPAAFLDRLSSRSVEHLNQPPKLTFLTPTLARSPQLAGPAHANPLLSASEGVLVFTVRGPTSNPDFTPLPLLASFGDFRTVKSVERHLQVVEFWDDRAAETAKKLLSGAESGGTRFGCSFEPSIAVSTDHCGAADLTENTVLILLYLPPHHEQRARSRPLGISSPPLSRRRLAPPMTSPSLPSLRR